MVQLDIGYIQYFCSGSIFAHRALPGLEFNYGAATSIAMVAHTTDLKNFSADAYKQGTCVTFELPAVRQWEDFIGDYGKALKYKGERENAFAKNKYNILKCGDAEDLRLTSNMTVRNGQITDCAWPLLQKTQSLVMYLNLMLPTSGSTTYMASENAELWEYYGIEYQTEDTWRNARVSSMHPIACLDSLVQMRRIPFSMPNDGHVKKILSTVENAAREVGGIMETVGGIAALFG